MRFPTRAALLGNLAISERGSDEVPALETSNKTSSDRYISCLLPLKTCGSGSVCVWYHTTGSPIFCCLYRKKPCPTFQLYIHYYR